MKTIKRLLSTLLVTALLCTMGLLTTGASAATNTQALEAKALYELGLFQGYDTSGTNFGLNDQVTREQALIFLIRMLGEEKAALAWKGSVPYSDVPAGSWALSYIGYAKEKGYTVGISSTQFGLGRKANMQEMTIFALRGLGYSDAKSVGDFNYQTCLSFAKSKEILSSDKAVSPFTRGVAVDIIFGSLAANIKGKDYDLLSKLMNNGVVSQTQYDKAMAAVNNTTDPTSVSLNKTTLTLAVGTSFDLDATVAPVGAKHSVSYTTSDASVIKLSTVGVVTGLKAGTCTVTVKTHNGKTATCKVTVTAANTLTKATFKLVNNTGKSIVDLYMDDSSASSYGSDFLSSNNYNSFSNGKYINTSFEFYSDTSFDFYLRFADGSEVEATGLRFVGATSSGGTINLGTNSVSLVVSNKTISTATFQSKSSGLDTASKKVTDRYNTSVTRYNTLLDQCKKLGLDKNSEFVAILNSITDEINSMVKVIGEGTGILTSAQVTHYTKDLDALDTFMNQLEDMIKAAQNQSQSVTVPVTIVNNTGVELHGLAMSPTKQTSWGSNLLTTTMPNGSNVKVNITFTKDTLVWDLNMTDSAGDSIEFYGIDFSACSTTGATLTLTYDAATGTGTATWG